MKKFIVLLLCFSILFSAVPVSAENTDPTITVGSAECQVGETVEISVSLQNNPGIWCFFLNLVYDNAKLKYNGATVNKNFSSAIQEGTNRVSWMNARLEDSKYTGEIFVLSFTALDNINIDEVPVSVAIDKENGGICNRFEEDVDFDIVSGKINILKTPHTPGDINGDKLVNLKDLVILAQYVAEWKGLTIKESALDVNGDNDVTLSDVTHLANYLAGWNVILN